MNCINIFYFPVWNLFLNEYVDLLNTDLISFCFWDFLYVP